MRIVRIAAALAALAAGASAFAIEWPLADPSMESTFGTVSDGRFLPGIEISASDATVRAVGKGEVLFCSDGGPDGLPSGLGSFVALAHDKGLVSVYGGLEPGSAVDYLKDAQSGDVVGLAGPRGGGESGIRFMLFDAEKGQFVNPLLFLRPQKDDRAPSIRAVYAKRDAQAVNLDETRSLRQGLCEIQAEFWDPRADGQGYDAPYQARVLLNGSEKINLTWDIGREREGKFALFSGDGKSIDDFFMPPGRFRLGAIPIPRGRAVLELIVTDFSQKSRSSSFVIQVE
jgi:hypothetical protein